MVKKAVVIDNVTIENAKIIYRNFEGKARQNNPEGQRNFCVVLAEEDAERLKKEGWNIHFRPPRDPSDDKLYFVQVKVAFTNYPPKIVLISSGGQTTLSEDDLKILDWAEIENVDLIIRPYPWEFNGKHGIKAYLKKMYVTIHEDALEMKYRNVPDSVTNVHEPDETPWD